METINKWKMNRTGLFNFWYYDDQIYSFANGKMLLRGSNGSGKSVTMQSLITVLLDGKKSPDRLDPFGSTARRMEDYLLGEKEIMNNEERTGYLFLEYKRAHTEQYLTTGIGLQAKRNGKTDFWGFIITDNRRIGIDFFLYHKASYNEETGKREKIPLNRVQLEKQVGNGGHVVRGQGEYMKLVNQYLFGFENINAYEDLMKLLIQLRSPKLSKEFKPTTIYGILNGALPPLTDGELRPLSDTIESMEQIEGQIQQYTKHRDALKKVVDKYDRYNQLILLEKTEGFLTAKKQAEEAHSAFIEKQQNFEQMNQSLIDLHEKHLAKIREQEVLQEEQEALKEHDAFKAAEEKENLLQKQKETEEKLKDKEHQVDTFTRKERKLEGELKEKKDTFKFLQLEIQEQEENLEALAEEVDFIDGHVMAKNSLKEQPTERKVMELWQQEARNHQDWLKGLLKKLREVESYKQKAEHGKIEWEEALKERDEQEKAVLKSEETFFQEREGYLEEVYRWISASEEVLPFTEKEISSIARGVQQLFEGNSREDVRNEIEEAYRHHQDLLKNEENDWLQQRKQNVQQWEEVKAELKQWKEKKEPEPPRHPDVEKTRRALQDAGIPHMPFYGAVEFLDEVTPETRERIESALMDMGFLDGLIVPAGIMDEKILSQPFYDRVLRPNPLIMAHTLADYLKPTPSAESGISAEDIMAVLASIPVEEDLSQNVHNEEGVAISLEKGRYTLSLLYATAPLREQALYIGKEAREQYRQRKIQELEQHCAKFRRQDEEYARELERVERKLADLIEVRQLFPSDASLFNHWGDLHRLRQKLDLLENEVEKKNDRYRTAVLTLNHLRSQLQGEPRPMNLPFTVDSYEKAIDVMGDYLSELGKLGSMVQDLGYCLHNIWNLEERLQEMQQQVDEAKGEVSLLLDRRQKLVLSLEMIEKRLALLDADAIQRRVAEVARRLKDLPEEIDVLTKERLKTENLIEQYEKELPQMEETSGFYEDLVQAWDEVLGKEKSRKLVLPEVLPLTLSEKERANILRSLLANKEGNVDGKNIVNQLTNAYYQQQDQLFEYRFRQEEVEDAVTLPVPPTWLAEKVNYSLRQLAEQRKRMVLFLDYEGKKVGPYDVLRQVVQRLEEQVLILSEKDKQLYEEVIMNSIGKAISERISRAEKWVEQMNQLMGERNNSTELIFSLQWKPLTADRDDQLDTKEVVELLRADSRWMKKEDMNKIVSHFKSQIEQAKGERKGRERGYDTLHQLIKEVLDYRSWFAFTLYYRKGTDKKKELTNHAFYKLSGGEKAMAMYIPLFTAAYSRYKEARPDAPHLICLDEAFAGVDEKNIRDMFNLVEQLGFDYIMNSQALWGDYDTVSSLAIYELLRPKNAPYVTVMPYLWDGQIRHLMEQGEMENGILVNS